MQLLDREGLKERQIEMCQSHLLRLSKEGKFPRSVKIGGKCAYVSEEVDAYRRLQLFKRDYPSVRERLTQWVAEQMARGKNPWTDNQIDDRLAALLKQGGTK